MQATEMGERFYYVLESASPFGCLSIITMIFARNQERLAIGEPSLLVLVC